MNRFFLVTVLLFFALLGGLLLTTEQGFGLLHFAEHRTEFWNTFFIYATQLAEEPTFAILTIIALFFSFRLAIKIPITGVSVMGLAYLLKSIFLHKRPVMYYSELGLMEQINVVPDFHLVTGLTSYPSGHTMGGFALFAMVAFHFGKQKWLGILCAILAILVGLSRIYLFQHFMKDVFLGGIIGIVVAYAIHEIFERWSSSFLDRKLGV